MLYDGEKMNSEQQTKTVYCKAAWLLNGIAVNSCIIENAIYSSCHQYKPQWVTLIFWWPGLYVDISNYVNFYVTRIVFGYMYMAKVMPIILVQFASIYSLKHLTTNGHMYIFDIHILKNKITEVNLYNE